MFWNQIWKYNSSILSNKDSNDILVSCCEIDGNVSEIGNGGVVTKMELAEKRGKVRFRIGVGVEEEEKFKEEGRVW